MISREVDAKKKNGKFQGVHGVSEIREFRYHKGVKKIKTYSGVPYRSNGRSDSRQRNILRLFKRRVFWRDLVDDEYEDFWVRGCTYLIWSFEFRTFVTEPQ